MAKKSSLPFDKRGGVVAIPRRLLISKSYLELSPQAKTLISLLQTYWKPYEPVGFGLRQAEKEIPCSRALAIRSFQELQEKGFITLKDESIFCSRTQSKSRTWVLSWLPWDGHFPTNKWEKKAQT